MSRMQMLSKRCLRIWIMATAVPTTRSFLNRMRPRWNLLPDLGKAHYSYRETSLIIKQELFFYCYVFLLLPKVSDNQKISWVCECLHPWALDYLRSGLTNRKHLQVRGKEDLLPCSRIFQVKPKVQKVFYCELWTHVEGYTYQLYFLSCPIDLRSI